ncbi:MAG: hypothetical protein CYPHOPRED_000119 [Cyphobasidiales sp. Tagirdzhanova-0007]|nr:MAG: hypothetical protein CYPHOPRED_000119 [Cyphobasidiales sp. Tagirdzhanova-0007]
MASSSSSSSASSSTSISSLLSQIKAIYDSSNGANSALLLVQAKIALAQTGLLLPGSSSQHSKADMETARDILSYGALLSVRNKDIPAFERYLAQLKPFWEAQTGLDPSPLQPPLTGLSLLRLLSNNEIAGFHTLLEELAAVNGLDDLLSNAFIKYPLDLERWLMEGSYSKVWAARSSSPMPEYTIFLDQLVSTVRNEIASCGEKAYASLPLHDAAVLLFFKDRQELLKFASERKGWSVNPSTETISFEGTVGGEKEEAARAELPKERVVDTILGYAKELETIV